MSTHLPAKDSIDGQATPFQRSIDRRASKTFEAPGLVGTVSDPHSQQWQTDGSLLRLLFDQVARHAQKGQH